MAYYPHRGSVVDGSLAVLARAWGRDWKESAEMWHVRSGLGRGREKRRRRREGELSREDGHTCEGAKHWQTWRDGEQAQDFILECALDVLDCDITRARVRSCRCSVENRPLRSLPAGMRLTCMQPRPGHLLGELGIWHPGNLAGPPAQPMIGLRITTCAIHSLTVVQHLCVGFCNCLQRPQGIQLCPSPRAMRCDQPASGVPMAHHRVIRVQPKSAYRRTQGGTIADFRVSKCGHESANATQRRFQLVMEHHPAPAVSIVHSDFPRGPATQPRPCRRHEDRGI
jgi:hypothetical protein